MLSSWVALRPRRAAFKLQRKKMNCPDCNGRGSGEYYTCSRCRGKGFVNPTSIRIMYTLSEVKEDVSFVTTKSIMERIL